MLSFTYHNYHGFVVRDDRRDTIGHPLSRPEVGALLRAIDLITQQQVQAALEAMRIKR